jgi:hypothetical protein
MFSPRLAVRHLTYLLVSTTVRSGEGRGEVVLANGCQASRRLLADGRAAMWWAQHHLRVLLPILFTVLALFLLHLSRYPPHPLVCFEVPLERSRTLPPVSRRELSLPDPRVILA